MNFGRDRFEDDDYDTDSIMQKAVKGKLPKGIIWAIGIGVFLLASFIIIAIFSGMFTFQTKAGYTYHYQNTLFGSEKSFSKPGVHFKLPFFSSIEPYKQVLTVSKGGETANAALLEKLKGKANAVTSSSVKVLFADTYTADIPGTFRFKLPFDEKKFMKMHHEFRTFDNLVKSLIDKTSTDVLINTATQYTGEEFFLGAINQFKASVIDQLKNGGYITERRRVEVDETSLAPVGLGQEDSNKIKKQKKLVWKTVPLTDDNGNYRRQDNPLDEYGITISQFTMGRPIPEKQLDQLLIDKKKLVADRIKTVQEQETAKEQAKTAQLKEEIERTRAKQKALKQKELAVIHMQQQVEEAEKLADKEIVDRNKVKQLALIEKQQELEVAEFDRKTAVVKKNKELDIAKANEGIQQANYKAAQYEGKAIKEVGLAEAAVQNAKYRAYIPEIYMAELQKDVSIQLYRNLGNFDVKTPLIMSGNTEGNGLTTNLKILSDFAAMNALKEAKNLD